MPSAVQDCVFCKIVAGDIPCAKVYENGSVLAFLDIAPAAQGHMLVVPKKHYATLLDLPPDEAEALMEGLRKSGGALRAVCKAEGFNCLQNNFPAAGQVVPHLHWHVIPRFQGDGLLKPWTPVSYADTGVMRNLAEKLTRYMQA